MFMTVVSACLLDEEQEAPPLALPNELLGMQHIDNEITLSRLYG